MKNIKALLLTSFFFLCLLSCSNTEETGGGSEQTTVKEDQTNLKNSFDTFHSCIKTFNDGTLADFVYESIKRTTVKENNNSDNWMGFILGKFEDSQGNFEGGFDYSKFKGKYVWDVSNKKWNKEASEIVELYFPSEKDKTTNNASVKLDSYESKKVTYDGEEKTVPLKAHIYGEIDGKKMFELTLSDVDIDVKTNFSMPLKFKIDMFVAPHNIDIDFKRTTPTNFDFLYSMKSPNNCGFDVAVNIETKTSDYGNFTSFEKDFKKVKGHFKHADMKAAFNVNVLEIAASGKEIDKLSESEINAVLDAEVLFKDVKIADLVYDKSVKEIPFQLIFKDGTKEEATKYTGDIEKTIVDTFKRFIEDE